MFYLCLQMHFFCLFNLESQGCFSFMTAGFTALVIRTDRFVQCLKWKCVSLSVNSFQQLAIGKCTTNLPCTVNFSNLQFPIIGISKSIKRRRGLRKGKWYFGVHTKRRKLPIVLNIYFQLLHWTSNFAGRLKCWARSFFVW